MMRTKERLVHVLQKQSSSAAVIFTLSPVSALSPPSFLSPQTITMLTRSLMTTRKPGNDAAPLLSSHTQAPGIQGSWHLTKCSTCRVQIEAYITYIIPALEFLRRRTDLPGQRVSSLGTCARHVMVIREIKVHQMLHCWATKWSKWSLSFLVFPFPHIRYTIVS